jgi:hypothetical protein
MQTFDLRREFCGKRSGGFKKDTAPGMPGRRRATVETEPRRRVNQLAVTIDEVRDPESSLAQIDRDLAPLTQTQKLALNGAHDFTLVIDVLPVPMGVPFCGAVSFAHDILFDRIRRSPLIPPAAFDVIVLPTPFVIVRSIGNVDREYSCAGYFLHGDYRAPHSRMTVRIFDRCGGRVLKKLLKKSKSFSNL